MSVAKFLSKNKKILIIISAVLVTAILILGIAFAIADSKDNSDGAQQSLSGVYSLALEIGNSEYTFYDNGSGSRTYVANEKTVTEAFNYVISADDGSKEITFTWLDSGKVESHPFSSGKRGGVEMIIINDVEYLKK